SFEIALAMAEEGADLIEIQIPFSDPLADGSTIMEANRIALENGTTPSQCFKLAEHLSTKINIPLLFMTYANIPFRMGFEKFVRESKNCGLSGLIIPDLTFDERIDGYFDHACRAGVYPVHVISPDTEEGRLEKILAVSKGFIYITLRVGITGAVKRIEREGIDFLKKVKEKSRLPLAAGFGLSSLSQIQQLEGSADMAVVGSHIINLYRKSGLPEVKKFLKEWQRGRVSV
ncbi:MAG: tryptophan synthase subunit alpha, partial [Candidatus Aminicenantes bacterium]|nr:tryptophan synthase subunit alpha [Candidatus Aminicenantes bacterium]